MVTIRDVAKEAGVSVATVSRIINNKGAASAETINHVKNVIDKLNYKPNALARSLSHQKSNLIALLVPTLNNPFFPELVREIENAANRMGYHIYLCNSDDERNKVKYYLDSMTDHYVAGAIINSLHVEEKDLSMLESRGIRTITIDRATIEHSYSSIVMDHITGAKRAVNHLIKEQNCKKVIFISGPPDEKSAKDRLYGFESAIEAQEEEIETVRVYGDFGMESGYEAIHSILQQGLDFDSIFSSNDAMAIGAMHACVEHGLTIPADVRVVGYDNTSFGRYSNPSLSSVDQKKSEIGKLAVNELLRLIKNKEASPKKYYLEPDIVVRDSSKDGGSNDV
jgi:LacI family transcriptional regulator